MEGRYFLTAFWAGAGAPRYPLGPGRQIIGRSERAQVIIRDGSVSREHAAVEVKDGEVWLEDLESKHGTFVNSKRVTKVQLQVGDIVVVGLTMVLRLDLEARQAPLTTPLPEVDPGRWHEGPTGGEAELHPRFVEGEEPVSAVPMPAPNLEAVGRLCVDALPGIYARVNMIADQLKQASRNAAPPSATVLLGWMEPILNKVSKLMKAITHAPGQPPPLVMLGDVVEEAMQRASTLLSEREVAVDRQVPHGLGLRVYPGPLAEGIAALLRASACVVEEGTIIEVQARASEDGTEVELLVPNRIQLRDDEKAPGGAEVRRARQVLEALGAKLTIKPGRMHVFLGGQEDEDYSASG